VGTVVDGDIPRAQGELVQAWCLDDEPVAHIAKEAMNKPRRVITGGVPVCTKEANRRESVLHDKSNKASDRVQ